MYNGDRDAITVLSTGETREDVLLGVIVHSKVLGRSRHHHHHHRHKRTHPPYHHSAEKRSKVEVGIGDVTPPESPKKPSIIATPTVTSSIQTVASSMTTTTVTSLPSVYGTGENEVTSTSITHFSAGIKDDDDVSSDIAYSPSDEIEKTVPVPTATKDPQAVTTEEFIAPLSPNTMSKLQSLIQTVKDSIASLPSSSPAAPGGAGNQEDVSQSTAQPSSIEEDKVVAVTNDKNDVTTQSAYVFHETLPVTTTSVAMVTSISVTQQHLPSTRQHSSFYGNQEMYNPHQTQPPMYGEKQFDRHHGYQGRREQWIPYRSNWSPQTR